jgi:hypothetical protein
LQRTISFFPQEKQGMTQAIVLNHFNKLLFDAMLTYDIVELHLELGFTGFQRLLGKLPNNA